MPDRRNSLRRAANSPRVTVTAALGCATVSLLVACSNDGPVAPGAPAPSAGLAFHKTAADSAAKDSSKAAKKAEHDLAKAQLDSLKADWDAYKKAVKKREVTAAVLRCEPTRRESETRTVGPKGGTLNIGPHRLVIPAGALDREVAITGTAPSNPAVNLEFAPHGLQFKRPVEMVIDYGKCLVPDDVELGVVYMLNGWRPVEKMPSSDARKDRRISALTDHFSGYVVGWSRTRAAAY